MLLLLGAAAMAATCEDPPLRSMPFCNRSLSIADRVADLLPRLTVEQQISQLSMRAAAVPALGLIEYNFGGEALHGLWSNCATSPTGEKKCPTQFGSPLSMGCSFNRRLWRAVGDAISTEIRALAANATSGVHSLEGPPLGLTYYAPNINLMRDPRWGRNEEVPSEDPFFTGEYGHEFTVGFQEGVREGEREGEEREGVRKGEEREGEEREGEREGVREGAAAAVEASSGPRYWKASVVAKHFAAYSLETSTIPSYANRNGSEGAGFVTRHAFDALVSERDLVETYLPAFERTVQAGAGGIMCSYNAINGVPACVNSPLLRTRLRGGLGFKGIVATDCGALNDADTRHNYSIVVCPNCTTPQERAQTIALLAMEAGVDSNCGPYLSRYLPAVLAAGQLAPKTLAASVARLLTHRFRLGLFEPNDPNVPRYSLSHVDSPRHRAIALKQARARPPRASGTERKGPRARARTPARAHPHARTPSHPHARTPFTPHPHHASPRLITPHLALTSPHLALTSPHLASPRAHLALTSPHLALTSPAGAPSHRAPPERQARRVWPRAAAAAPPRCPRGTHRPKRERDAQSAWRVPRRRPVDRLTPRRPARGAWRRERRVRRRMQRNQRQLGWHRRRLPSSSTAPRAFAAESAGGGGPYRRRRRRRPSQRRRHCGTWPLRQ